MESQADKLLNLVKEKEKRGRTRIVSVASGKGGVGKTGFATSLAYVLANTFSKKVLLLDCDIGLGNVHLLLGLNPERNLKSVLSGRSIEEVVQSAYNFDVVLGFSGINSVEELESVESSSIFLQLESVLNRYDYVILDNSAGLNRNTIGFSRLASVTYVVTTPEPTALTDAYAFIKSLYKLYGYSSFKVVVNMVSSRREGFETFERLDTSTRKFLSLPLKLAGILPLSKRVKEALKFGRPVLELFPGDEYSVEMKKIAQLETGEAIPEEESGIVSRLLRFLREGV